MPRTYTAFISYRHLPLDMAVAERLQTLIERYRIPKAFRKNGEKGLGIVFRDRSELPLSSNLTQDIYQALDNSRFLIVVCTPETRKSMWVQREIQYFIRQHGRNRVLAVLAKGTPEESIPPEITTVYAEDGVTILDRIEPLCADLVAPDKKQVLKKLNMEFLRLAAAMLDVPYDALFQRRKRYLFRLAAAGIALASAVVATIIALLVRWNLDVTAKNEEISQMNIQIQDQLLQTQREESEALTLLSQSQLSQGDRIAAIRSALDALPGDEDRPYYAGAEAALASALAPYSTQTYQQTFLAEHSAQVLMAEISPDGRYLATVDHFGTLRCFDPETGRLLWTFAAQKQSGSVMLYYFYQVRFGEDRLYFFTNTVSYFLSLEDGALLFSEDFNCAHFAAAEDLSGYCWIDLVRLEDGTEVSTLYYRDLEKGLLTSLAVNDLPTKNPNAAFSTDGSIYLFTRYTDPGMTAFLYNVAENTLRETFLWRGPSSTEAILTPLKDGTFLIAVYSQNQLILTKLSQDGRILAQQITKAPEGANFTGTSVCVGSEALLYMIPTGTDYWKVQVRQEDCTVLDTSVSARSESYGLSQQTDTHLIWYHPESGYALVDAATNVRTDFSPSVPLYADSWTKDTRLFAAIESAEDGTAGSKVHIFRRQAIDPDARMLPLAAIRSISPSGSRILGYSDQGAVTVLQAQTSEAFTLPGLSDRPVEDITFLVDESQSGLVRNAVPDPSTRIITEAVFSADETRLLFSDGSVYDLAEGTLFQPEGWIDPGSTGPACCSLIRPLDAISGKPPLYAFYQEEVLSWSWDAAPFTTAVNPYHTATGETERYQMHTGQNGLILLRKYAFQGFLGTVELGKWDTVEPYTVYDTETDTWKQFPQSNDEGGFANICLARNRKQILHTDPLGISRLYDFETGTFLWERQYWFDPETMTACFLQDDAVVFVSDDSGITILDAATGDVIATLSDGQVSRHILQLREVPAQNRLYLSCWDATEPSSYGLVIDTEEWIPIHSIPRMSGYVSSLRSLLLESTTGSAILLRPMYTCEELIRMGSRLLPAQ